MFEAIVVRRLSLLLLSVLGLSGMQFALPAPAVVAPFVNLPHVGPAVDIPTEWRRKNWAPYGEGSCMHA